MVADGGVGEVAGHLGEGPAGQGQSGQPAPGEPRDPVQGGDGPPGQPPRSALGVDGVAGERGDGPLCLGGIARVGGPGGVAEQIEGELLGDEFLVGVELLGLPALLIGDAEPVAVEGHPHGDRTGRCAGLPVQPVREVFVAGVLQAAGQARQPLRLEIGGGPQLLRDAVHQHDVRHRPHPSRRSPRPVERWAVVGRCAILGG